MRSADPWASEIAIALGLAAAALLLSARPAWTAEPVTIVEDVSANVPGVELMDYLSPGKVIRLPAQVSLTLGYLHSCVQETITGGTVTVGEQESTVIGGKVDRRRVECDGGRMLLTADQANKSGVMVFRRPPKPGAAAPGTETVLTLYGLSPVVTAPTAGTAIIVRVDQPGERLVVKLRSARHSGYADLASEGRSLAPGGLYRISIGQKSVDFRISPSAKAGPQPPITRLIRL